MNDEEKRKIGKRFFDVIDKIMLTPTAEQVEARRQERREGNVYQRTTQAIGDAKDKVLGTVFSPVAKGIQAVSDATNIDERAIPAAAEIILTAVGVGKAARFPKSTLVKSGNLGRRLSGKLPIVKGSAIDDAVDVVNPYKITSQTQRDVLSKVSNKITSVKPITITSTGNVPVVVAKKGPIDDDEIYRLYKERQNPKDPNTLENQLRQQPKQLELDLTAKPKSAPPMQMLGTQTQLSTFFPWESTGAAQTPKANYGDVVNITPRRVKRNQRSAVRKNIKFKKVDSIDLTNGFKPTKIHRNFEEYIQDLLEADKIPAQNITPRGFQALGKNATSDLELYEDYIAGYFNTYGTLQGVTKVTLGGKGAKFQGKSLDKLPDVERILKAYKLNPTMFSSGAFNANTKVSKDIVADFANAKDIDDYIVKNLKLQRHHIAILDDSFALVDGLTGNDLNRIYQIMDEEGLIVGNDPRNLQLLPQIMHQGFIHGTLWPIIGPEWTGVTQTAKILKKNISRLPVEQRRKYVIQLKNAITELNLFIDDIINSYIKEIKNGGVITLNDRSDFIEYAKKYMAERGIADTFDVEETIRSTFNRPDLEDQEFGQGRMQDDLQ